MNSKVDLKCKDHNKQINRVTFESYMIKSKTSNTTRITKLFCTECEDLLPGVQTIKLQSLTKQLNMWASHLESYNKENFIQNKLEEMIEALKELKINIRNRLFFNKNTQFNQRVLSYILCQQILVCDQKNQEHVKAIKEKKQAVDQLYKSNILKFQKNFNENLANIDKLLKKSLLQVIQSIKKQEQQVKQKPQGIKKVKLNQKLEPQITLKKGVESGRNKNQTPQDYQDQRAQFQNLSMKMQDQNEKVQSADTKSRTAQPSDPKPKTSLSGLQYLQNQMKVPQNAQFDIKQSHEEILFTNSNTICEPLNKYNTIFSLCKPNFSPEYNSRLFKILSCDKYSQIFVGAGFKTNLRRNRHADNYGYHQGIFCIKGSPAISNLWFYSHQYKKQLSLPNYSLQAGYVIEVRVNFQNCSFQFSIIKPIFRHLGSMLYKRFPNDQEFTPLIGMKGNVKIRIINKEKQENLKIMGDQVS